MGLRGGEGFSIVEAIVTLAVVAILAAALSPLVVRYVQDTRRETTLVDMAAIGRAYARYFEDTGRWPCDWDGSRTTQTTLTSQQCFHRPEPGQKDAWRGPYLERGATLDGEPRVAVAPRSGAAGDGLLDGWGEPYTVMYQAPTGRIAGADGGVIAIVSGGADRRIRTSRRRAVEGTPVDDDLVHVVTRKVD